MYACMYELLPKYAKKIFSVLFVLRDFKER